MKKRFPMMRRLLSLGLAFILSLSVCIAAYADSEYIHGYFRYTVEDNSVTITAYTGKETVVTVPSMIGGNPVNTIASGAFANTNVTTVYLPDTIMSVESGAFGANQRVVFSWDNDNSSGDSSGSGDNEGNTPDNNGGGETPDGDHGSNQGDSGNEPGVENGSGYEEMNEDMPGLNETPGADTPDSPDDDTPNNNPAADGTENGDPNSPDDGSSQDNKTDDTIGEPSAGNKPAETEPKKDGSVLPILFFVGGAAVLAVLIVIILRKYRHDH